MCILFGRSGKCSATLSDPPSSRLSDVRHLVSIRNSRGLSLRAVEQKTRKQVSNAYLSQIENGKIKQPSPNILLALAELCDVSFERMMEKAGYIKPSIQANKSQRKKNTSPFFDHHLTTAEELELLQYLDFIRSRKRCV